MKYKGILLDIDNTLYDYDKTHKKALNELILYCNSEFNIPNLDILDMYDKARKRVHLELSETASSHNRLLYIQKMLEMFDINSIKYSLEIYDIYWNTFLANMDVYEGVYEFLEMYKFKICLVTDLTAHIQHRKMKKLKLDSYVNLTVTSEENGKEKPHPCMFVTGLQKLNLEAEDVCMIGDSFKKDILGATNLGIQSIWLNYENKNKNIGDEMVQEVKTFKEILGLV